MIKLLKDLLRTFRRIIKSKYKWLFILFAIWIYRIDFMPADGGGFAKAVQVVTLFGIYFLVYKYQRNILGYSYNRTNVAVKSWIVLYVWGVISSLWAFLPTFAFFLALQNIILCLFLVWFYGMFRTFKGLEKAFLLFVVSLFLFEAVFYRLLVRPTFIIHYLPSGSTAGMCMAYCSGEILAAKLNDNKRKKLLKGCFWLSFLVLLTSTSTGANLSALFGISMACMFGGKPVYAVLMFSVVGALYLFKDILDYFMNIFMPGKDETTIQTATGRTIVWDEIKRLSEQRPLLGWGYGCVERVASVNLNIQAPDAHNNWIGLKGSLGWIGLLMGVYNMATATYIAFTKRMKRGYVGLLAAIACGIMNGYSFGYLAGKACSITIVFCSLCVLTFYYNRVEDA